MTCAGKYVEFLAQVYEIEISRYEIWFGLVLQLDWLAFSLDYHVSKLLPAYYTH